MSERPISMTMENYATILSYLDRMKHVHDAIDYLILSLNRDDDLMENTEKISSMLFIFADYMRDNTIDTKSLCDQVMIDCLK